MKLEILIKPECRDFQSILWRFSPDEPLQVFRLITITYGVNASYYKAIKTVRTLAHIYAEK